AGKPAERELRESPTAGGTAFDLRKSSADQKGSHSVGSGLRKGSDQTPSFSIRAAGALLHSPVIRLCPGQSPLHSGPQTGPQRDRSFRQTALRYLLHRLRESRL